MRSCSSAIVALMLGLTVAPRAQAPTIEYDVKAAFLLNFARFVEWPGAQRGRPFDLCTLQPDPFGPRLEAATSGERWDGWPIAVHRISSLRDVTCHLLYVPGAAMPEFRGTQGTLAGRAILTVGETDDFLNRGGMIRLFVENNRVRFSINQKAAEAAGLRVSSRLLRLARDVISKRDLQ